MGPRDPTAGAQRLDALAEGSAVGVLEHEVWLLTIGFADVVDRGHPVAADAAQGAPLRDEPLPDLRIHAVVLGEDLDRDGVVQALVDGAVHRGERPRADALRDEIGADAHRHAGSPSSVSMPATIARPRLICDLTVPRVRPVRSATCAYVSPCTSRSTTGIR